MIRALELLSLALIAACVAHTHAAPAGPPQAVCQAEGVPQDPYAARFYPWLGFRLAVIGDVG